MTKALNTTHPAVVTGDFNGYGFAQQDGKLKSGGGIIKNNVKTGFHRSESIAKQGIESLQNIKPQGDVIKSNASEILGCLRAVITYNETTLGIFNGVRKTMITITTMIQLFLTKAINQMIVDKLDNFYWTSITIIRGGVDSIVTGEYYGAVGKVMVIVFQKEHK